LKDLELPLKKYRSAKWLIWISLIVTAIQIAFGTQIRELIDEISAAMNYGNRELWIENVGFDFIVHRSFSWVVLGVNLILFFFVRKVFIHSELLKKIANWSLIFVVLQIATGLILAYQSLPPVFQTLHLWLATFLTASQFLMLVLINMYAKNDSLKLINKI